MVEWIKKCKVCNLEVDPKDLAQHDKCLQYSSIIRNEKV